jgi:hypothetical protein
MCGKKDEAKERKQHKPLIAEKEEEIKLLGF